MLPLKKPVELSCVCQIAWETHTQVCEWIQQVIMQPLAGFPPKEDAISTARVSLAYPPVSVSANDREPSIQIHKAVGSISYSSHYTVPIPRHVHLTPNINTITFYPCSSRPMVILEPPGCRQTAHHLCPHHRQKPPAPPEATLAPRTLRGPPDRLEPCQLSEL